MSCLICQQGFYESPSQIKKGRGKYCSNTCKYASSIMKNKISKKLTGRKLSSEHIEKIRAKSWMNDQSGEKNHMWDKVQEKSGYSALHEWVKRRLAKPLGCNDCGEIKPLDLANISQEYKRDLSDWEWLCRKCHIIQDGRLKLLIKKGQHLSKNTEFIKGQIPWNKHMRKEVI